MWGFLIGLATGVWDILQTVADAAIVALTAAVSAIWNTITLVGGYLASFSRAAWGFLRFAWDDVIGPMLKKAVAGVWTALRATWDHVLGPIVDKFRGLIDWLRDEVWPYLHDAVQFLQKLQNYVLTFYKDFIRPVLDILDATQRVLKLLELLHVKFAAQLDAVIGEIEHAIQKPFSVVLSKLNEVIGWVNRIVTVDGLLQRFALIGSLERDYKYAWRALVNPLSDATPPEAGTPIGGDVTAPTVKQTAAAVIGELNGTGSADAAIYRSATDHWRSVFELG